MIAPALSMEKVLEENGREKSDIGVESKQKPNTVLLDCGPTVLVAPTGDNDRVKQTLQMESERV